MAVVPDQQLEEMLLQLRPGANPEGPPAAVGVEDHLRVGAPSHVGLVLEAENEEGALVPEKLGLEADEGIDPVIGAPVEVHEAADMPVAGEGDVEVLSRS